MILYPFQPDLPFGYSVAGFDEEKKTPGAELYLLPPGAQIPAEFTGGAIFSEAPGCADARILQPAQSAAPAAAGGWADPQVSGGGRGGGARNPRDLPSKARPPPPPRPPASLRLDPISARPPGEGIWSVQIQKSNAKRCSPANPACTFYL